MIKAHKLQDHLCKEKIPVKFGSDEDHEVNIKSQEYLNWEMQDHHLAAWLLASMDLSFTTRVVGCTFAHEIWHKIEVFFASQTRARVKQLKIQLKAIRKQGMTASEYLLKIKKLVDSLAAIGAPLSVDDYIEVILDGLNEEYGPFITTILSRAIPFTIDELEALLMAQDGMLERFNKSDLSLIQENVAQTTPSNPKYGGNPIARGRGNGGRHGRGRSSRGGRGSRGNGTRP